MNEGIHQTIKIRHIKWGDTRVFGEDSDIRRKLTDREAVERFAQVWQYKLANEVANAPEITRDDAKELLEEKLQGYVTDGYSYRQFSLHHVPFIARITMGGYCDQLWALGIHRDNTRLCMHFDTIAQKNDFDKVAKRLGWEPKVLAVQLCIDFIRKVERQ